MRLSGLSPDSACNANGLTLIEVVIAVVVFAVGALGLATASATIGRQLAMNAQRGAAASVAASRAERFHAAACGGFGAGAEWTQGLRSEWSSGAGAGTAELDHRIRRPTSFGLREDRFMSGAPCE